ncbi:MAG: DUF4177 domain-containing protein [Clostridiaceae bacterium]
MYEYKFINSDVGGLLFDETYEDIIKEYASQGWKLVQILPKDYTSHGKPNIFQVILERKLEK